jgi:hypothetical protein
MANKKDWMPAGKLAFVSWSESFVSGVVDHQGELNLTEMVVTALQAKQAAFMAAWTALNAAPKGPVNTAEQNALVKAHQKYIRLWVAQYIRGNPALTNAIRAALGMPVEDDIRTPQVVGNRTVAFTLEPGSVGQVVVKCRDKDSGAASILYGMSGITLLYDVADTPFTDPKLLTQSALLSRVNHTLSFPVTDSGKRVSVAACWQSKAHGRGDFAVVQTTVVP